MTVLTKVFLCRPESRILWRDDCPAGQRLQRACKVWGKPDGCRSDNLVVGGHPQHPLIKSPVTQPAECHTVADVVITALTPRHDMGSFNNRMPFWGDNSYAAQGTAVVVGRSHNLTEPLVTHRWPVVVRLDDLFHQRHVGLLL